MRVGGSYGSDGCDYTNQRMYDVGQTMCIM